MPPHHAPLQEGGCSGVSSLLPRWAPGPRSAAPRVSGTPSCLYNSLTRGARTPLLAHGPAATPPPGPSWLPLFPLPRSWQPRQSHSAPPAQGSPGQGCLGAGGVRGPSSSPAPSPSLPSSQPPRPPRRAQDPAFFLPPNSPGALRDPPSRILARRPPGSHRREKRAGEQEGASHPARPSAAQGRRRHRALARSARTRTRTRTRTARPDP